MAALDLHCGGVDPGVCVWSGECVDSLDSFDYEMQQWEEQLQEVQRKIEELYKVVEARRGAAGTPPSSTAQLDISLLPVQNAAVFPNNGYHAGNVNNLPAQHKTPLHPNRRTGDACGSGLGYPRGGAAGPRSYSDQDAMLDILDGYLGTDAAGFSLTPEKPRKTPTTSSAHTQLFYTDQWPVSSSRTGCAPPQEFEEAQNQKNRVSVWDEAPVRHVGWKDPVTFAEKSLSKPPMKQRDSPQVPPRTAHYSDSPRCPLVDRRCGSPSVLRKFGAMLQENEGKTLIEDGIVTALVPKSVTRSLKLGGTRGSRHVTARDADGPVTLQNREHRGAKAGVRTSHWSTENIQTDVRTAERILGNCSTPSPHQASCDSSPMTPRRRSFSRPARPSNQRPPSRWASHAPAATTPALVIPRSRSLSPACKSGRRPNHHSLYTETVIM